MSFDPTANRMSDEALCIDCFCLPCQCVTEPQHDEPAREAAHRRYEEEEEVYGYSCGSNYCDDPACIYPHPELL